MLGNYQQDPESLQGDVAHAGGYIATQGVCLPTLVGVVAFFRSSSLFSFCCCSVAQKGKFVLNSCSIHLTLYWWLW